EEEERRPRLEQRILRDQLLVALLQRAQVLFLLFGQLLEDRAPPRVARQARGARVELEAAALGGDRHAQRVAREDELGRRAVDRRRLLARPALLARAVDLDDLLRRREVARGRDLLHQRLDVRAEELRRAMARRADQMKVARVTVRRLEARAPL